MKHVVATALLVFALAPIGAPAFAGDTAATDCYGCETPKKNYDSVEVVKTKRDVDHSRVINTTTIVPVYRRPRPMVRVPVIKVVNIVVQRYHVVEVPNYAYRPLYRPAADCSRGRHGRYSDSCRRVLRVRG